jgi:hypothetical protein
MIVQENTIGRRWPRPIARVVVGPIGWARELDVERDQPRPAAMHRSITPAYSRLGTGGVEALSRCVCASPPTKRATSARGTPTSRRDARSGLTEQNGNFNTKGSYVGTSVQGTI